MLSDESTKYKCIFSLGLKYKKNQMYKTWFGKNYLSY